MKRLLTCLSGRCDAQTCDCANKKPLSMWHVEIDHPWLLLVYAAGIIAGAVLPVLLVEVR